MIATCSIMLPMCIVSCHLRLRGLAACWCRLLGLSHYFHLLNLAAVVLSALLQAWQRAVPREVLEGLLATESLRRQHGLKGVAGCLVDLLDVPPQLVTAADVVAGNQLFQVRAACGGSAPSTTDCHTADWHTAV
jgi:hypothetical protein